VMEGAQLRTIMGIAPESVIQSDDNTPLPPGVQ
jgi:hypothetical protein